MTRFDRWVGAGYLLVVLFATYRAGELAGIYMLALGSYLGTWGAMEELGKLKLLLHQKKQQ